MLLLACGDDASGPETPRDAGPDAARADVDASIEDARVVVSDASVNDAEAPVETDAGSIDCSAPADGVLPRDLRCTGLYKAGTELAEGLIEYTPAYVLWSDDADKRRFASFPAGTKIDVRDPNAFVFPEGTKFWKEFSVLGSDGRPRRAETRLLQKGPDGWLYTSYVWNAAQTEAIQMDNTNGVPNQDVGGTAHIVPTRDQCNECHGGRTDQILGWDAVMLGSGATIDRAQLAPFVDALPAATIPGSAVEQAALGYLHANCGVSCHNELATAKARDSGLFLRLEAGELATVQATDTVRTGMNKQPSPNAKLDGLPTNVTSWRGIRSGQPDRSLLVARQRIRGFEGQMPRIGTKIVDEQGVQSVVDWIEAMPTIGGYPAPAP